MTARAQPGMDATEEEGPDEEVTQARPDDSSDDDVDVEGHDEQHEDVGQQDVQRVQETGEESLRGGRSAGQGTTPSLSLPGESRLKLFSWCSYS